MTAHHCLFKAFVLWSSAAWLIHSSNSKNLFCQANETASSSSGGLGRKWALYHAVIGEDWVRRGTIQLQIAADAAGGNSEDASFSPVQLSIENDQGCLSDVALQNLQESAWYKLKLVEEEEGQEESAAAAPVITTVSACQLRRANFRDELVLTFGRQGHVVSMAYMPMVSPLAPKSCDDLPLASSGTVEFTSRVSYETAVPGMTLRTILPSYQPPPGLKLISKKGRTVSSTATQEAPQDGKPPPKGATGSFGGGDEEGGANKTEEPFDASPFGFLKRYWYIIVPLMIVNFMSAGEQPPEEGGQQQQGGQQQGGGGAQAAAAPPAAGNKRRGKRSN